MSSLSEANAIDIKSQGAISFEDITNGIVNVSYDFAKVKNSEALEKAIKEALKSQKYVKIPEETFLLGDPVVIETLNDVTIVNQGTLIKEISNSATSILEFHNCKNVCIEGGLLRSDTGVGNYEWTERERKNPYSTMLTGIKIKECENVEIKYVEAYGIEYGVYIEGYEKKDSVEQKTNVIIHDFKTEQVPQPIYATNTQSLLINSVYMVSPPNMGKFDHFISCPKGVENLYIGGNIRFLYSDSCYGSAIDLCNDDENAESVKLCRVEYPVVNNLCQQFVSAKADTKVICNGCTITTKEGVSIIDDPYIFFVQENATIDIVNCIVDDKTNSYNLVSLLDDVHVNVSGGNFTGLSSVVDFSRNVNKVTKRAMLNVSSAYIKTNDSIIEVPSETTGYVNIRFNNCDLFTQNENNYFFQNGYQNCKIACCNCDFEYIGESPANEVYIAYLGEDSNSMPLMDNIKIINCTGTRIKDVYSEDKKGYATIYGNYFSYTEDGVTKINSTCVPDGSITLNMFSPELKTVLNRLLTTS